MDELTYLKNFNMGREIELAGQFLYEAIHTFNKLEHFEHEAPINYFLYHASVGFERLQKVILVLYECHDITSYENLREKIKSHNYVKLQNMITECTKIKLKPTQNSFLDLLEDYYRTYRYGGYELPTENIDVRDFLVRYLNKYFNNEIISFAEYNVEKLPKYKKFIYKVIGQLAKLYFDIIQKKARVLNIYTYELNYDSAAYKLFYGSYEDDSFTELVNNEEFALKELLIFMANHNQNSKFWEFLKNIQPLELDIYQLNDYLEDICKYKSSSTLTDMVTTLYEEFEKTDLIERKEMLSAIGNPNICFDYDEENDIEEEL